MKFLAYWQPIFRVQSCKAKLAEEARGLIGFHRFTDCPDCRVIPEGFELWGENGHKQGACPIGSDPLAYLTRRMIRDRDLEVTGGSPIFYRE